MDNTATLLQIADDVHQIHVLLYFLVVVGFGGLIVWLFLRPLLYFIGR